MTETYHNSASQLSLLQDHPGYQSLDAKQRDTIVSQLYRLDMGDGCPVRVSAAVLRPDETGRRRLVSGRGLNREEAESRCLAEAHERSAAAYTSSLQIVQASTAELGHGAIDPNSLLLISGRQHELRDSWNSAVSTDHHIPEKRDMHCRIGWVTAQSVFGGEPVYLPAAFCFLGYPWASAEGFPAPDSNGLACGDSLESALERSILEVIERDAVSIWWYGRVRRPAMTLDREAVPGWKQFAAWQGALNRSFWILDLTSDLNVPAAAAISCNEMGSDLAFGFGAARTPEDSAAAAMGELVQFEASKRLRHQQKANSTPDFVDWCHSAQVRQHEFLRPHDTEVPLPARRIDSHADLEEALGEQRLKAYFVKYAATGPSIHVTRAVVPGLRHMWPRFAKGRLYDVPFRLGWHKRVLTEKKVNPVPILY